MDDDARAQSIKDFMRTVLQEYDDIRGKYRSDGADLFYDAVVVSTSDEEQSKAYQSQIRDKVERSELPADLPFYIFADPPGVKIGSGGSILYSLWRLHQQLGDTLYGLRLLLICGGGQSQRLPTSSILGKLFQPLPFGRPPYHMLDLKLAMYRPFARTMRPGVLVTCSDDVETFYLAPDAIISGRVSFDKEGFVALGHVSSIEIGLHHGVYVLPDDSFGDVGASEVTASCLQVLQKPTADQMKNAGAILADGNVCTDSVFFFDHAVTAKFVGWSESRSPRCEIDAYGDFLPPLGARCDHQSFVAATSPELASARTTLYSMLRGTPLHVVLLARSRFYHLGTMTEFIEHLTAPTSPLSFFDELGCQPIVFSRLDLDHVTFSNRNPRATVVQSAFDARVQLGVATVVEYCHILTPLTVGPGSILSHCRVEGVDYPLPGGVCYHTAAVTLDGGGDRYVTTAFGIRDDLKARGCSLVYLGVTMEEVCSRLGVTVESVLGGGDGGGSLWNARLFKVGDSPEEAFRLTVARVRAVLEGTEVVVGGGGTGGAPAVLLSVAEVVRYKQVERMLAWRSGLRDLIGT